MVKDYNKKSMGDKSTEKKKKKTKTTWDMKHDTGRDIE